VNADPLTSPENPPVTDPGVTDTPELVLTQAGLSPLPHTPLKFEILSTISYTVPDDASWIAQ
jgi:hypothetical protein